MRSVEVAKRADQKLILIPVVFILVHIWGTIRFFRFLACLPDCQNTGPSHALPVLIILQVTVGSFYLVKRLNYTQSSVQCMIQCSGGSRGRVQGVRTSPSPPLEMTCSFLIQLVFTSGHQSVTPFLSGAPLLTKILDLPLQWNLFVCCLLPAIPSRTSERYSWF